MAFKVKYWEYLIQDVNRKWKTSKELDTGYLDRLGLQGWELVSVTFHPDLDTTSSYGPTGYKAFLKRPMNPKKGREPYEIKSDRNKLYNVGFSDAELDRFHEENIKKYGWKDPDDDPDE